MTFTYDPEGRLSKATQTATPAENATYKYDAMSRLARRTINHTSGAPTVIGYVHDLDDHIIAETDASGATLREYIWMDDLPVAVVDNVSTASPIVYRVHTDHLMRPIRITTNGGVWVWSAEYTPFGAVQALYPTATTMDLRFPGQWFQLENGLHYNWHRHYDASTGRYVQADPLLISEIPRTAPHVSIAAANFVDEIIIDRTNSESLKFNPTAISKLQRVLFADGPSIFSYAIGSPLSRDGSFRTRWYTGI